MKVDREELLRCMEAVSPGLDKQATIDQSDCLIFEGGKLRTYNIEVACWIESPLGDFTGALKAESAIQLLQKLTEKQVQVSQEEGLLIINGKRRRAKLLLEESIRLPSAVNEEPEQWVPLSPEFGEAVDTVRHCVSRSREEFIINCIHIHPEWVEATDDVQLARYFIKTGVAESCLVRPSSVRQVVQLGMNESGLTKTWLHFRNAQGLHLSCRKYMETFPPCSEVLAHTGQPIKLPSGLKNIVDRAEVFSVDNADQSSTVEVRIKGGKIRIKGVGPYGEYEELKVIDSDADVSFVISSKMLVELAEKSQECQIVEDRMLLVDDEKYKYATALFSE